MNYKLNETGQYEPQLEYTSDPYEKELLKRPIGFWGSEWKRWIEDCYPSKKDVYIVNCSWCIIPRQIDVDAHKYYEELFDRYDEQHGDERPSGDDFLAVVRWEKEKQLYIQNRIREDIVHVLYAFETDKGRSIDELDGVPAIGYEE